MKHTLFYAKSREVPCRAGLPSVDDQVVEAINIWALQYQNIMGGFTRAVIKGERMPRERLFADLAQWGYSWTGAYWEQAQHETN